MAEQSALIGNFGPQLFSNDCCSFSSTLWLEGTTSLSPSQKNY